MQAVKVLALAAVVLLSGCASEALRREPEDDGKMLCSFCHMMSDPEGHRWECTGREPTGERA